MVKNVPKHVAIIMDGNRRWAKGRGLASEKGHAAGTDALEKIVEEASKIGIGTLTVYALSTENLHERPRGEIVAIFEIIRRNFKTKMMRMMKNGVRIEIVGEIEGLPEFIKKIIVKTKNFAVEKEKIKLNIAFNYGGKKEILVAIQKLLNDGVRPDQVSEKELRDRLYLGGQNDPELVIRTGGKIRLSNFLLWQTAYSELYFSKKLWPDFSGKDLKTAVQWFDRQQRNFGK